LRYFREEVQPTLESSPGFKRAVSLHDLQNRHNGRTISITFWESEDHMHDNGETIAVFSAGWRRPRAESWWASSGTTLASSS
jgi:heme-degrading monooxygenase HmoA